MKVVKATREGLLGGLTASGYKIDAIVPFVALPSKEALFMFVRVSNPATGLSTIAIVLDVGPWNTHDNGYVFGEDRPQAETGIDSFGRPTNSAGIDLGEKVWKKIGMSDNSEVEWEFIS